ncbi:hypothetical protein T484DRAFT_1927959 [Baffinella frigidus]|nr:hypothetical protein T484DRAFT_1927959 [Cryptophyta sp. CCMP2293]
MVVVWTMRALNQDLVWSSTSPESMELQGRTLYVEGMPMAAPEEGRVVNVRKSLSPLRSSEAGSSLRGRLAWDRHAAPTTRGSRDGSTEPMAAPKNMQLKGRTVNLRDSFSPEPLMESRAKSAWGRSLSPPRFSRDGSNQPMAAPESMPLAGRAMHLHEEESPLRAIRVRSALGRRLQDRASPLSSLPSIQDPRRRPPPLIEDPACSPRSAANRVAVSRVNDAKPFSVFSPKASAAGTLLVSNGKDLLAPSQPSQPSKLVVRHWQELVPRNAWRQAQRRSPPPPPRELPTDSRDVLAPKKPEKRDQRAVRQHIEHGAARHHPHARRAPSRLEEELSELERQAPAFSGAFNIMPEEGTYTRIVEFLCAEILSRVGQTTPSPRAVLSAHLPEFQGWMVGAGAEHGPSAPVDLVFIAQISRAEDNSFSTLLSLAPPTHAPPPTPKGAQGAWTDGAPGTPGGRYLGAVGGLLGGEGLLGGLCLDAAPERKSRRATVAGEAWGRMRAQSRAVSKFEERLGSSAEGGEERDGWFQQIVCKRVALLGVKSERDVMVL